MDVVVLAVLHLIGAVAELVSTVGSMIGAAWSRMTRPRERDESDPPADAGVREHS